MEASLHPDGGYYALKDGEAPAQSMRSKNLRHVEIYADIRKIITVKVKTTHSNLSFFLEARCIHFGHQEESSFRTHNSLKPFIVFPLADYH
jgi:hypothetical protein